MLPHRAVPPPRPWLAALALSLCDALPSVPAHAAQDARAEAPPAIHITRDHHLIALTRALQASREQCVDLKDLAQEVKRSQPDLWPQWIESFKEDFPNFNVFAPLAPEPDWATLNIERQEEFFDGPKHALYRNWNDYTVADDGTCRVVAKPRGRAELDDGVYQYDIDTIAKSGIARLRPNIAATRAHAVDDLNAVIAANSALATRAAESIRDSGIAEALEGAVSYPGSETVAGERCDYVASPITEDIRICRWSKLPEYSSEFDRPVVLKIVDESLETEQLSVAIRFDADIALSPAVFKPATDVRVIYPRNPDQPK